MNKELSYKLSDTGTSNNWSIFLFSLTSIYDRAVFYHVFLSMVSSQTSLCFSIISPGMTIFNKMGKNIFTNVTSPYLFGSVDYLQKIRY